MLNETYFLYAIEKEAGGYTFATLFMSDFPQKMNTMTLKARDSQLYNKIQCPKRFSVGGWSFGCANERLISRNLL